MTDKPDVNMSEESIELLFTDSRPLARHPAVVYLASLSESSRRTMFQALDTIARLLTDGQLDVFSLNWSALRYEHAASVRAQLAEKYKPATANKMLSALRQVLHHAWTLGLISENDYVRARSIESFKGDPSPTGRDLDAREIEALMEACETDPSPAGARDAAIIAVMYATGIRRRSVVRLDRQDYDPGAGTLCIREEDDRAHLVYIFQDGVRQAMADWLSVRGDVPGALFWPVNKAGHMANRRLSTQAIYNVFVKRAREAGIAHLSPHDLRRTLAADLLSAGADVATVQQLLGNARSKAANRDNGLPDDVKRQIAHLIRVPYRGRRRQHSPGR